MNNIPLITFHQGNPFFLKHVLAHASYYNSDSIIYLLGDESNQHLKSENIKHFFIKDFYLSAQQFSSIYKHLSSNTIDFELRCFSRWFIIRDFMTAYNIDTAFVFDSDLLLFTNISEELKNVIDYDFTFCSQNTPISTILHLKSLNKFIDMLNYLYGTADGFEKLKKTYQENFFNDRNERIKVGGISDMTMFDIYRTEVSDNVLDISIPRCQSCFDIGINNVDDFERKNGYKKIHWINNLPYCRYGNEKTLVRMCSLHFPINTKFIQHRYYINSRGIHYKIIPLSILLPVLKALMKKGYNGMKHFSFYFKRYVLKRKI